MQDAYGFERQSLVVEHSGGGTRFVLPRRQLAGVRKFGWIIIGFGGFVTAFMIFWMSGPILSGVKQLQEQQETALKSFNVTRPL